MRIRKHGRLFSSLAAPSPTNPYPDAPATDVCDFNDSPWNVPALSSESRNENEVKIEENRMCDIVGNLSVYALECVQKDLKKVKKEVAEQDVEDKEETGRFSMLTASVKEKTKENIDVKSDADFIRCKINGGKGWRCKREAKEGESVCKYHYMKRKLSYKSSRKNSNGKSIQAKQKVARHRSATPRNREKRSSASSSDFYYYSGFGPSHSHIIDEEVVLDAIDYQDGSEVVEDEEKEQRRFSMLGLAVKRKAKEKLELETDMDYIRCTKQGGKGYCCYREAKEGRKFCEYHLLKNRTYYKGNGHRSNEKSIHAKQSKGKAATNLKRRDTHSSSQSDYYYYSGFGPAYSRDKDRGGSFNANYQPGFSIQEQVCHDYNEIDEDNSAKRVDNPFVRKCFPVKPEEPGMVVDERKTNYSRFGPLYSFGKKWGSEIKKEAGNSTDEINSSSLVQEACDRLKDDYHFLHDSGDKKGIENIIQPEPVSLLFH